MTENENNLDLYKRYAAPPKDALKTIRGGRLAGMTDVNPQWRLEALTEAFGPVGKGWSYRVVGHDIYEMEGETSNESSLSRSTKETRLVSSSVPQGESRRLLPSTGSETTESDQRTLVTKPHKQAALFVHIELRIEGWHPIPGSGGSMLVSHEKGGLRLNDEAWKMAITDALSVCCKQLGIGSDIYRGYSDSKYQGKKDGDRPAAEKVSLSEAAMKSILAKIDEATDKVEVKKVVDAAIRQGVRDLPEHWDRLQKAATQKIEDIANPIE